MLEYKKMCRDHVEQRRMQGKPEPEMVPHPDDIIIGADFAVSFAGPMTRDENKLLDSVIADRDGYQEVGNEAAARYPEDLEDQAFWLDYWQENQAKFDEINRVMPLRYRAELRNRMILIDGKPIIISPPFSGP